MSPALGLLGSDFDPVTVGRWRAGGREGVPRPETSLLLGVSAGAASRMSSSVPTDTPAASHNQPAPQSLDSVTVPVTRWSAELLETRDSGLEARGVRGGYTLSHSRLY